MITNNIICGIASPLIIDIVSNCSNQALKNALSNDLNITFRSDKQWCDVK